MDYITDSNMTEAEALAQNPAFLAPKNILDSQSLLTVKYYSFDGLIHQGQIVMHKTVADDVLAFFEEALRLRFPIEKVTPIAHTKYLWDDETSLADNNTSGYNFRYITGGTRLSNHARGTAFDVNTIQNPYIKYNEAGQEVLRLPSWAMHDNDAAGTLFASHPLVLFMKSRGWTWGGDWEAKAGPVDYQHFEKILPTNL